MAPATTHRWQFTRAGGFDQVRLDSAADLAHLGELDQKLWAALACPVKGLEFDERTLALIDTDADDRIRVPEILAAVAWAKEHLRDVAAIKAGSDSLPISAIADGTDSARAVLTSAKQILKDLGKADATLISLADVSDTARIFAQTRFNGDGVVPPESADDPVVRAVIADVVACLGGETDRSGRPGVTQAKVDAFFAECAAFEAWAARGDADPAVRPLGDATAAAGAATRAVRAKVDDWFARCRLAAYDARSLSAVNRQEAEYLAIAAKDLSITAQEIAGFPIAQVAAHRALPLGDGVNPAWAAAVAAFRAQAVAPLLGDRETLTESEWAEIGAKLAAHEAWTASKPATSVEKLGRARVAAILAGGTKEAITALVAEDKALEPAFQAIAQVERLIRYHRGLWRLLHNFVNFADFYSPDRLAVFEAGTLYLDARACELCVRVADAGKHAALAAMAKAYLAYCDCTRPGGEKMTIAAAFTGGDSDFLMVGRNGVFYDRKGRDWDATIVKVVENPISVRQAFWAPYKKLVRFIEEQVAKRAAAADAEADAKVQGAAAGAARADKAKAPPEPKRIDVGTVAAIGVAVAGIGTFLTALIGYLTGIFQMPFWIICIVLAGILLAISTPSMLIAWLKLRQRNLAPILDANGWAVNGRVKLSVPFGGSLTSVAALPAGSLPATADPFAERPSVWPRLLGTLVVLAFLFSLANHFGLLYTGLRAANVEHPWSIFQKPGEAAERAAKDAYQEAAAYAKEHPDDKAAQKARWEAVAKEHDGTEWARDAAKKAEALK